MFNFWTFFFGAIIIALSGLKYYSNHKELPIQIYGKGCDIHRDRAPLLVAKNKRQRISPIVMLGLVVGILGNIPNVIILFRDYIIPTLK
jgi:hypothetical protein